MARSTFLDKFSGGGPRARTTGRDGLAHVLRNLEAVLNTKAGYGFFRTDFGLGAYTEKYGTRDLMATLTRELKDGITEHEPRLSEVELTLRGKDGSLWLHFGLSVVLGGERHRLRLLFDTISARVRLEEEP